MAFIARFPGLCGHCDEELKGSECSYAHDETIVHTDCLLPYNNEVRGSTDASIARNERKCGDCFQIHAGECA
jgi:hypothetical protein